MNNWKYKITIIILLVALLALGGYVTYNQFLSKDENGQKQNQSNNKEDFIEENEPNDETPNIETNPYETYLSTLSSSIKNQQVTIEFEQNVQTFILGTDKVVYIKEYEGCPKQKLVSIPGLCSERSAEICDGADLGIKLNLNNIIQFYYIDGFGQSNNSYLFALDNNGNIYLVTHYKNTPGILMDANYTFIKIEELKEIVSLDNYYTCDIIGCTKEADFVDIYGKRYGISDIIKKYNLPEEN